MTPEERALILGTTVQQPETEPNIISDAYTILNKPIVAHSPLLQEQERRIAQNEPPPTPEAMKKSVSIMNWLGRQFGRPQAFLTGGIHGALKGQNPLRAGWENQNQEEPALWGQVIRDLGGNTENTPTRLLAGAANVALDPLWLAKPFSLTEKGIEASKALGMGKTMGSLGEQAAKGERAVLGLGLGEKPWITTQAIPGFDKSVLGTTSKAADLLKKVKIGDADLGSVRKLLTNVPENPMEAQWQEKYNQLQGMGKGRAIEVSSDIDKQISSMAKEKGVPKEVVARDALRYREIPRYFEELNPYNSIIPIKTERFVNNHTGELLSKFGGVESDEAREFINNHVLSDPEVKAAMEKYDSAVSDAKQNFASTWAKNADLEKLNEMFDKHTSKFNLMDIGAGEQYRTQAGYVPRIPTEEFSDYMRKTGEAMPEGTRNYKKISEFFKPAQSQVIRGKGIEDINSLASKGALEGFPGFQGKAYLDNPTQIFGLRAKNSYKLAADSALFKDANRYALSPEEFEKLSKNGEIQKNDWMSVNSKKSKTGEVSYYPKSIGEVLNRTQEVNQIGPIGSTYDKGMSLLKKWWLSHVSNMVRDLGGNIQQIGASPASLSKTAKGWGEFYNDFRKGEQTVGMTTKEGALSPRQVADELYRQRIVGAYGHVAGETGMFEVPKSGSKLSRIINTVSKPLDVLRSIRNPIEDAQRAGMYKALRESGYSENSAGPLVREFMHDWADQTKFDRQIAGRVMPLTWNWWKRNLPLTAKTLIKKPAYATMPYRFAQGMKDTNTAPDERFMSDWQTESAPIMVSGGEKPKYVATTRWLPFSDPNELVGSGSNIWQILKNTPATLLRTLGSALPPPFTSAAQAIQNRNWKFNAPIERSPGEKGVFMGIPMRKRLSTLLQGYIPDSKLGVLWDEKKTPQQRVLRALSGINEFDYEPWKSEKYSNIDHKKALLDTESALRYYRRKASDSTITEKERGIALENWKNALDYYKRLRAWEEKGEKK